MKSSTQISAAAAAAAAVCLFACSDPSPHEKIDAQKITQTTRTSVAGHLTQINEAIELVGNAPFFTDLENIFDAPFPATGLDAAEIAELAEALTDRFFAPETIIAETETRVVYRIDGARLCDGDSTCRRAFAEVPVRLEVVSPREGALEINVFAGEAADPVSTISLDDISASVAVNIAQLRAAAELFAPYFDIPVDQLPSTALGAFTVAITKNAQHDYTATLSIGRDIQLESTHPDFIAQLSIAARTSPVLSARLDGNARRFYGDVDFAAVEAAMPAGILLEELTCSADEVDCGPFHGVLSAHLAGASASLELTSTLDRLLISNVGLGDATSRIQLDQTNLIEADVNALHDRRFDVELAAFDDFVEASVRRAFTLDLGLDLAPLNDQVDDLPAWTAHDRLHVRFDGAAPNIRIGNGDDATIAGRSMSVIAQVLSGELEFSSDATSPVVVPSGECLYFANETDDSAHPFSAMDAAACP